jgi:2-polyprenyl-3-methyl-5-hydroxy-6-metoxy-1,4-benzoquinol methylase
MDTQTSDSEPDLLDSLRPLMEKYGARCTPKEFYDAVNLHFHAAESSVYDEIHREMWKILPLQFALLTDDCLPVPQKTLRVLDVGSGTGLSAELFLKTNLGSRTNEIHLLDTSKEMLSIASERGRNWAAAVKVHCCSIAEVPATEQFDVILACSLLHHIADLTEFFKHLEIHQRADGLFLHIQDQNADYAQDQIYLSRLAECREVHARQNRKPFIRKLTLKRIYRRIMWELSERQNYIMKTNKSLIRAGIISRKMDALDIWGVTDIRITPTINGISLRRMHSLLPSYELISSRSYSFYGEGGDNLPAQFRAAEMHQIEQRAMNGHLVAGAWKRRPNRSKN